jgi:hypothetical protein
MKTLIALAASLVVTFGALGVLDWSAQQAQIAPIGEVSVTQLPEPTELSAYAQTVTVTAAKGGGRTAGSL